MTESNAYQFSVDTLFNRWVDELSSPEPNLSLIASIEAVALKDGWSVLDYATHVITAAGCVPKKKRGTRVKVIVAGVEQPAQIVTHIHNPANENDPLACIIASCGCGCGEYEKRMTVPESHLKEYDEDEDYDYSYEYGTHAEYETEARQKAMYDALEDIEEIFGKFDHGSGANGAHYVEVSPFADEGIVCANCVFYKGPRGCEVVEGDIDPNAVCKLWIVPGALIEEREDYEHEMLDGESLVVLSSLASAPPALRPSVGTVVAGAEDFMRSPRVINRMWDPDLHPRGGDGRFIVKFGWVTALIKDWDSMDAKMPVDRPRNYRARVVSINPDPDTPGKPRIELEVFSSDGTRAGFATVTPDKVTHAAPSKARLDQILNVEAAEQRADKITPTEPPTQMDLDRQEARRVFREVASGADVTDDEVSVAADYFARLSGEDGEEYTSFMDALRKSRDDEDYIDKEEIIPGDPVAVSDPAQQEARSILSKASSGVIITDDEFAMAEEYFTRSGTDSIEYTALLDAVSNLGQPRERRSEGPVFSEKLRAMDMWEVAGGDPAELTKPAGKPDFSMPDDTEPFVLETVVPRESNTDTSYGMYSAEGSEAVRQALARIEDDVAAFMNYKPMGKPIRKSPTTVKQVIRGFAVPEFKELQRQFPEVSDTEVREMAGNVLDSILGKYVEPWQIRDWETYNLFTNEDTRIWGAISLDKWRAQQAKMSARQAGE